ncbi:MAG: outer membrane beta-barrel protein [Bacteroides sp.]|nr:outer membrane beta-barrel protein [Bacteroides sp.]
MKRIITLCLLIWLATFGAMAQRKTHDINGVVTDQNQQPVIGALVSAEGTDLTTLTNEKGEFALKRVPLGVKKLIIRSAALGVQEIAITPPTQEELKARRKIFAIVSAGVHFSRYTRYGGSFIPGYEVGVGAEFQINKRFALRPMLQLSMRGSKYTHSEEGIDYKETWKPLFVDFTVNCVHRVKFLNETNLLFSYGPAVSVGVAGKVSWETNGNKIEHNIFTKTEGNDSGDKEQYMLPVNFGLAYGVAVEYKQMTVGISGKNMFLFSDSYGMDANDTHEHNWVLGINTSYRF